MSDVREFERIVEYSYNPKQACFVVRFLDGSSYVLDTSNLPKKMQTKKPEWEESTLNADRCAILVHAGEDLRIIPAHIIHARGKAL